MKIKKSLIPFMLILASLSTQSNAEETVWSFTKDHGVVPHSWDVQVLSFEESAYSDVLRVVDEINRKNGISKRYVLNNGRVPEITDNVDIVPIFMQELKNYKGEGGYTQVGANKYYTKEHLMKILNSKDIDAIKDFSYADMQQEMRYYFGNGNKVKDIIIEDKAKFKTTLKDKIAKKEDKYLIDGIYKSIDTGEIFNTLKITSEEYKKNFLTSNGDLVSVHNENLLNFMKDKIAKEKGVDVTVKDGELWTKKGENLHRVQWHTQAVSRPEYPEENIFNFLKKTLASQGIKTDVRGEKLQFVKAGENKENPVIWGIKPNSVELENDKKLENFIKDVANSDNAKITKKDASTFIVEKDGKSVTVMIASADKMKDVSWYKNTLLTQLNVFKDLTDRGQYLYTKDGSIIVENIAETSKLDAKMTPNSNDWYGRPENITTSTSGRIYDAIVEDYNKFKNNEMTAEEFKDKWDFKDNNFEVFFAPIKIKSDELKAKTNELKEKSKELGGDSYGSLYYEYFESDWYDKGKIYDGTSETSKKFMKEKNITLVQLQKILDDTKKIKTDKETLEKEIPELVKKAGVERFSNSDVIVNKYGKIIEFRGRGRVDGTIDLGKGYNRLRINEQFTGRYGTNIVFGSDVKLKNIDYIAIGGQYTASTGGVGLSGKSSLALEIDPNKVKKIKFVDIKDGKEKEEEALYQHALKDTWTDNNKVVLKSWEPSPLERDSFAIELKVSGIGKDTNIDMGRPLEYKAPAFSNYSSGWGEDQVDIKANDILTYRTNFYSDSIAHELILKDLGKDGKTDKDRKNGVLGVHLKDSLKRLSKEENEVFKSISHSGGLGHFSDTLTTSNKKTQFSTSIEEDNFEKQKVYNLVASIVAQEKPEVVLEKASHLAITDTELLKDLKANIEKVEKDKNVIDAVGQIKTLKKYQELNLGDTINKVENSISTFKSIIPPDGISWSQKKRISEKILEKYGTPANIRAKVEEMSKYAEENFVKIAKELEDLKPSNPDNEVIVGSGWNGKKIAENLKNKLEALKEVPSLSPYDDYPEAMQLAQYVMQFRALEAELKELKEMTPNAIYNHIVKELEFDAGRKEKAGEDWINLISNVFYTQRQSESLKELKILLNQISETNIYSKVNKISKNEIDVYSPLVYDRNFDFTSKKADVTGGAISGRYARNKIKGTIYTAYGMYERALKNNLSLGMILGGGSSSHHEIVNDTITAVTTNSKINGNRAYLGLFGRYNIAKNMNWINGLGLQYAKYDVDRNMKNHYQEDTHKGKVNTFAGNLYSGLTYKYKLNDTLDANLKGGLSYTMINQGKATEENSALSLEINKQNFNYLDGQVGIGLTKTIYGNEITSSLSGTLYAMYGITGYDNKNLKGQFKGSDSSFAIKGESYQKQATRLKLDYNVQHNTGLNYGLYGSYTKNSNEDNISIGVKAGYKF